MDKIYDLLGSEQSLVLTKSKISSIEDIILLDNRKFQELTNFQTELIKDVKFIAAEHQLQNKIKTADQIPPVERLSTGCKNIDGVLNGGIPINGICELYGSSGVGKTQFCLQLSLQIQLPPNLGGISKEVVYISTESVFPFRRLVQLANAWRQKYNITIQFEDHIHIKQINESIDMLKCLENDLPNFMDVRNVGIIIIDSIAGLFRADNKDIDYVKRSMDIHQIARNLNLLQDKFNCYLFVINQVTDNLATGETEPYLGLAWANNLVSRFQLCKAEFSPQIRRFEVIFNPELECKSTNFILTQNGFEDL